MAIFEAETVVLGGLKRLVVEFGVGVGAGEFKGELALFGKDDLQNWKTTKA